MSLYLNQPIEHESIYASSARFDTGAPLTEDALFRVAPSIFEFEGHPDTTELFAPVPTISILRGLARAGFVPVGARQSGDGTFTKHLVRLRHVNDLAKPNVVNGTVMEIMLRNANDGSAAFEIFAALYRIICLNSLVAASREVDHIRVFHKGDVMIDVIEGVNRVLGSAELALVAPQEWPKRLLDQTTRDDMSRVSHTLRFNSDTPFTPKELLKPRRAEDDKNDLYSTFNVLQENIIKGGLSTYDNRGYTRIMKPITNIDRDVGINSELWRLAETVYETA